MGCVGYWYKAAGIPFLLISLVGGDKLTLGGRFGLSIVMQGRGALAAHCRCA